jgi:acyl carrier protein
VKTDPQRVLELITEFLDGIDKPTESLSDETSLYAGGLEMDSLEAAELSAMLEDEFGSDPFTASEEPPETIGEIVAFYRVASSA